jgi:hypothetical protein
MIPVKVVQANGEVDSILLEGREGEYLNTIKVGDRDYFFDKDGNYDGFGDRERAS